MQTKIKNTQAAMSCIYYVLEHEGEDYATWCDENGHDPKDVAGNAKNHVYASALLALGLPFDDQSAGADGE